VTRSLTVKSYQITYLNIQIGLNPFDKNEDISTTMTNNIIDSQKMAEKSCQKLMDVDIEKIKDQQIGEQTPKFLICLLKLFLELRNPA
jgi:hypothetical protein